MKLKVTLAMIGLSAAGLASAAPAVKQTDVQRLELGACNASGMPADARCGIYEVFENRAAHSGRKIPLRVVVLPALGPDRAPDAVTYFAGGPGDASVSEGIFLAQELKALRQHRDFLLVDMRGTGGSAPLNCPELQGITGVQGFLDDFLPADKARACRDRLMRTVDLSQYTTANAVDDVDEVRAALGYPQVDAMGGSYGTRAVLVYLRRHPERVRTAVLHGVVPTNDRAPLFFARSVQKALDGLMAECAGDGECAKAFPKLKEDVAAVLARVEKEPARVELSDAETGKPFELRLSRNGVAQTLRYMLYIPSMAAMLPLSVHQAAQGNFRPLAETARTFGSHMTSTSDGFYLSVTCAEDVAFVTEPEVAAAVAGTFLGDFRIRRQQAACAGWPVAKVGDDFLAPVVSDVPTLITSGERDPVTPASDGEEVTRTLRHSRHLIIPDGAHSLEGLTGLDCLSDLAVRLVEAGSIDGLDTSCLAKVRRPPFVLGFGAPPVTLSREQLELLVGNYADKDGLSLKVELVEGRLRGVLGGKAFLLVPTSPTNFRPEGLPPGYVVTFERSDGPAKSVTLVEPGQPELRMECQR